MKSIALLLGLLLVSIPLASFAADADVVRGEVSGSKKLPLYSNKDLDEALKITDECSGNDYMALHYDCDCVGMTVLELRRKRGDGPQGYWLKEEAQRKCPNAPAMAGKVYSECLQWAPRQRGDDYQEFCSCYGSTYAKIYAKNPTSGNLLVSEAQMTEAMEKCNPNAPNVSAQERTKFVDQLKANGTYDKLFPSANGQDNMAAPPISGPLQTTPQ